ncbi:hypothetical protein EP7_000045 [Isosphaeraceae bacterium EP7]
MAKQRPDLSLEREGRPLKVWLQDLVAEEAPTRRAAGDALQAMMYGVPSVHTDLAEVEWGSFETLHQQPERFKDAVRSAVESPGFAAHDFVSKLILYRTALRDDWQRRVDKACEEDNAPNAYQDRLLQRLQAADGDIERTEAARRYMRWVCASMDRNLNRGDVYAGAEAMATPGVMAAIVFDSLDVSLLADRSGLYAMLGDKDMRRDAARALARIGPPGVNFAAVFFEELDAENLTHFFEEGARALGSIGRDNADVIDGLLGRLRSGPFAVRSGAAAALFHSGPSLAGRLEIALDLLLEATQTPGLVCAAIPALASVGRDSEMALRRVLEVSEPRTSRLRSARGFPDQSYDEVMAERGAAIDSLHHFKRFADRAVPALVDALDTFQEYDPDWGYEGEHGRVCAALMPFGPLAALAVPRLVQLLEEWLTRPETDREWPKDVIQLLASFGPPAAEALPLLEQLRSTQVDNDEPVSPELDPDEPLDRAIVILRRVTGKS